MLKKIHIDNFKSLLSLDMETASLNILTGLNSSGKSSVMQALSMAEKIMTGHSIDDMGHVSDLQCRYATDKSNYGITLWNQDGETRKVRFDGSRCESTSFWKEFHFIGADRLGPRVSYHSPKGANPVSVGEHGENVIAYIRHYERDLLTDSRLHEDADGETVYDNVNAWMGEICPGISYCLERRHSSH
ncbi:MAG: AAA family ATPase [Desulfovibrio sp.]|nr:AAA family ATPase [Desulfovibrio sp.]